MFAGSGALGFEAASRSAKEVVMVEKNRTVFKALQDNLGKLGLQNITLRNEDGLNFAQKPQEKFDVIFLDPPFSSNYLQQLWPLLPALLAPQGVLYAESGAAFEAGPQWQQRKQDKAGAVHYQLLEIAQHD